MLLLVQQPLARALGHLKQQWWPSGVPPGSCVRASLPFLLLLVVLLPILTVLLPVQAVLLPLPAILLLLLDVLLPFLLLVVLPVLLLLLLLLLVQQTCEQPWHSQPLQWWPPACQPSHQHRPPQACR